MKVHIAALGNFAIFFCMIWYYRELVFLPFQSAFPACLLLPMSQLYVLLFADAIFKRRQNKPVILFSLIINEDFSHRISLG